MQSRLQSFLEVNASTAVGFIGSYIITILCLNYLPLSPGQMALATTLLCTIWSLVRGYFVRRYFNGRILRMKHGSEEHW